MMQQKKNCITISNQIRKKKENEPITVKTTKKFLKKIMETTNNQFSRKWWCSTNIKFLVEKCTKRWSATQDDLAKWSNASGLGPDPSGSRVRSPQSSILFLTIFLWNSFYLTKLAEGKVFYFPVAREAFCHLFIILFQFFYKINNGIQRSHSTKIKIYCFV